MRTSAYSQQMGRLLQTPCAEWSIVVPDMNDTRECGNERSGDGSRSVLTSLVRLAGRLADTAVQTLLVRANTALDAYRGEIRRLVTLWMAGQAILLFVWSGVVFAALAIVVAFGVDHRLAGMLCAAAAFLVMAVVAALFAHRLR